MRPEEVRALGDLAGEFAAGIATQARDVHEGIAGRVFGALGEPAAPVRAAHDAISTGAYGAARLQERRSPLVTPMSLRRAGADVALDAESVARAFPDATGRLAVFVHGLGETEDAWSLRSARHRPYGDRLRAELGYTPLFVRYNSGLYISHNGRALGALIERLTAVWPVPVAEIALFGHSMGGLVARGACHYAGAGMRVGFLARPGSSRVHARLATQGRSAGAGGQRGLPRALAAPRDAAVRHADQGPRGRGQGSRLRLRGRRGLGRSRSRRVLVQHRHRGPFLESANHYFVSATVTRDAEHPLGRMVGDLLVRRSSAWSQQSRGEQLQFALDHYAHLGGATHFGLLNHPAVYAQLRRWLTTGRGLPAPV